MRATKIKLKKLNPFGTF